MSTVNKFTYPESRKKSGGRRMPAQDLREEAFIRHKMFSGRHSAVQRYSELVIGTFSFFRLLKYELITCLFGPLPGAVGLFLRKLLYPLLFDGIGKGVIFGRNVVLRHCDKIRLGDGVVIDDYTFLDARGAEEEGIVIEDEVIIARGCYIQAKVGPIHIGRRSTVGVGTMIVSQGGVYIGERVSIAGGCKISGGLFQIVPDPASDPPYRRYSKGPVRIEKDCLVASGAVIIDGVTIEEGTLVGAGSVVSMALRPFSITSPRPVLVMQNPVLSDECGSRNEVEREGDVRSSGED